MVVCFTFTAIRTNAQHLFQNQTKPIPRLSLSLIIPEVAYELPLNFKSTSLKFSVKPLAESYNNTTSFYPILGIELRKYKRKKFTNGVFEGGYFNLFNSTFFQKNSTSNVFGLMYGTQNYFGKNNAMFYDLGGGLLHIPNDEYGIEKTGIYPGLQIRFGFRIM